MDGDVTSSLLRRRSSVIKWVGKGFTPDIINYNERKTYESSKVGSIRRCTRFTAQRHEQASIQSYELRPHQQTINKNESAVPSLKIAEGEYGCKICKKSFKWRSHWKAHERIHTGERPFKCEICGKAFTRSDGLQCHKKVHIEITKAFSTESEEEPTYTLVNDVLVDSTALQEEKVFICALCGRTFGSFGGYCRHIDRHKDKEDLKCRICSIVFNRPSALEIHNRIHTGLKPFLCHICSKAFSVRGNLKRHVFTHTGERPFNCTFCSSCFNNSSHLTRHVRSKHEKRCRNDNIGSSKNSS